MSPKNHLSIKLLLEIFLDFTFFLCISPFRIVKCDKTFPHRPKIRQWKQQKILAGLFSVMDIFGSITRIRLNLEKKLDNPVGYFNFMWSIAVTMMHLAFYFVLWTKQRHLAKAIEILSKSISDSYAATKLPCNTFLGFFLCCLSLIFGLLPSLKGSHLLPHSSSWNIYLVFRAHVAHGRFMFFLANTSSPIMNETNYTNNTESLDDLNGFEIAQGIGHILVYTIRYLGAYFIDLFMIMLSVTLWLGANEFVQQAVSGEFRVQIVKTSEPSCSVSHCAIGCNNEDGQTYNVGNDGSERNSELVKKYADLKCLSYSINGAMSPILFCYVFEAIFYHATNLNLIFTAHDWHSRLTVTHFLLGSSAVFGFSADVARKMDEFRLWLVTEKSVQEEMVALIHETQSKAIGVSAFGIFTIDYPLIFNIVTTTVTFFLIVVQFVPKDC